jgi:hypothetical protein
MNRSEEIVFIKSNEAAFQHSTSAVYLRARAEAERREAGTSRRGRGGVLEHLTSVDITLTGTGGGLKRILQAQQNVESSSTRPMKGPSDMDLQGRNYRHC